MDSLFLSLLMVGVVILGLFAYGGWIFMNPTRTAGDRLEELTGGPKEGAPDDVLSGRIAERLAKLAQPESKEERDILKAKLIQAGYKSRHAQQVFNAVRVSMALIVPLLIAPPAAAFSWGMMGMLVVVGGAIGYYGPYVYINNLIQARQMRIVKPLPDALDLLVTSVEAGLGLDAAFRRVAAEMEGAAPELSAEFQMVTHEVSGGIPRLEALHRLAERTGIDEIRSLVNMLAQAERFGTSIARSLRIYSEISRQKRMSRAEEEAAKVSPKLTMVMILFFLPVLMTILLGPAAIRISQSSLFE